MLVIVTVCKQIVTRLLSSRYQDVFALFVPSCCDKSGTSCYHLVTRLITVTDLLQVVPTRLIIQAVRNKLLLACHQLVTCRRCQTCWNNLLRVCWPHQPCYERTTTCSRLVTTTGNEQCDHMLLTSCEICMHVSKFPEGGKFPSHILLRKANKPGNSACKTMRS